ncbi:unnamed protein product [Brachionus calyciflorus]|uniref:MICOS complex subunit MIC13 n=1 Tax=Brachionus calyciflorus TaxID=104777 RepID=A0A813ZPP0_9BILA|nr:unnamed protein product [Brachionus calyciflorus]
MLSFAKLVSKLAIVGGAVYVTVNNSVWDKSEYANKLISQVKESLPEATELIKEVPAKISLVENWNNGVESVFNVLANSSRSFENLKNKIPDFSSSNQSNKT